MALDLGHYLLPQKPESYCPILIKFSFFSFFTSKLEFPFSLSHPDDLMWGQVTRLPEIQGMGRSSTLACSLYGDRLCAGNKWEPWGFPSHLPHRTQAAKWVRMAVLGPRGPGSTFQNTTVRSSLSGFLLNKVLGHWLGTVYNWPSILFFFISNFWSNIINIVKERVFGARDFIEILALLLLALWPWARSHMSQFLQVNNRLNATYVVGELWRGCCGIVSCWLNGVPNTVSLIVSAEQITVFPHLCPRVKNYKCCLGKCCQKILKSTTVKEWMPTGHEHIHGCSMFS